MGLINFLRVHSSNDDRWKCHTHILSSVWHEWSFCDFDLYGRSQESSPTAIGVRLVGHKWSIDRRTWHTQFNLHGINNYYLQLLIDQLMAWINLWAAARRRIPLNRSNCIISYKWNDCVYQFERKMMMGNIFKSVRNTKNIPAAELTVAWRGRLAWHPPAACMRRLFIG